MKKSTAKKESLVNSRNAHGKLVIIGGREDKTGDREILKHVASLIGSGKLVVATVASELPQELWTEYSKIFTELGVKKLAHLDINFRGEAYSDKAYDAVEGATGIFFTGGDQLRITSDLGGTEIGRIIDRIYLSGGFIAGTSAGASVMSETMMVSGPGDSSVRSHRSVLMAPGLGYVKDFIIDQHFSERGRISRLMAAVTTNPRYLGLGIDENTAVVVDNPNSFHVIGVGAVYVINGERSTESNIRDSSEDTALSVHNLRVDVLCRGEHYDIRRREPIERITIKRERLYEERA